MSSFITYTIQQGDNLQLIAQKHLKDASRGMEIALLNDLDYPFIDSDVELHVGKNVKSWGDTLYLPIEVDNSHIVDHDGMSALPFGTDLMLHNASRSLSYGKGGELVSDGEGDLQTVSGIGCLVQDIRHRLMTDIGSLPYHPEYGSTLNKIVGNKNDSTWSQKALIEVHRCMLCDPRIKEVVDLNLSEVTTGIHVSCRLVTYQSQELLFREDIV